MRQLPRDASLRARRWDVVVLGSGLPGLVASIRLARSGLRVLVVEEEASTRLPAPLRDPFLLPGTFGESWIDACLRALGVPLIERRGLVHEDVAFQVLLPEARIDVGAPNRTAEELVAWGVAKPDQALALVRELEGAALAEQDHWLAAPVVRGAPTPAAVPARANRAVARGLPASVLSADGLLARVLAAPVRALSNLAQAAPAPEARARLLGSALGGAGAFTEPGDGLRRVLRRRLEALHVEFRTLASGFRFVELADHPGLQRLGPEDVWLGRALLLNAPLALISAALRGWGEEDPGFLEGPEPTVQREGLMMRALRDAIPEPLAPRAILADPERPDRWVTLVRHPSSRGTRFQELALHCAVPRDADRRAEAARMEAIARSWLPFSEGSVEAAPLPERPLWDDDQALCDPSDRNARASQLELRTAARRPVFALPREAVAGLGVEGDLLLGWRAGDAIRAQLG